MNFSDLGVSDNLAKGLAELGIVHPTDVQIKAIPLLLAEQSDLVVQAQTGTGKTAAYGVPMLEQVDANLKQIQALVLVPTRELGQQVAKQLFKFTKYSDKIFTEAVYGGEQIDRQISALRRPTHIVVATPGRLIDLVKRKAIDLRQVKLVVLDEADEMLNKGFKPQIDEVLNKIHTIEQRWLFSATMPKGIRDIIKTHLSPEANYIELSRERLLNDKIEHQYVVADAKEKDIPLMAFLKQFPKQQGLVFCRTKASSKALTERMQGKGLMVDVLNGDMKQKEREKVLRAFKKGQFDYLIATDVAARGLDIHDLGFVVHYELPESDEFFTHRCGRTARGGKKGISVALVTPSEVHVLRNYERSLRISFQQVRPRRS